jgi:hypothetical protein
MAQCCFRNNKNTGKRLEKAKDFNPSYQTTENDIIEEEEDQENINWVSNYITTTIALRLWGNQILL